MYLLFELFMFAVYKMPKEQ